MEDVRGKAQSYSGNLRLAVCFALLVACAAVFLPPWFLDRGVVGGRSGTWTALCVAGVGFAAASPLMGKGARRFMLEHRGAAGCVCAGTLSASVLLLHLLELAGAHGVLLTMLLLLAVTALLACLQLTVSLGWRREGAELPIAAFSAVAVARVAVHACGLLRIDAVPFLGVALAFASAAALTAAVSQGGESFVLWSHPLDGPRIRFDQGLAIALLLACVFVSVDEMLFFPAVVGSAAAVAAASAAPGSRLSVGLAVLVALVTTLVALVFVPGRETGVVLLLVGALVLAAVAMPPSAWAFVAGGALLAIAAKEVLLGDAALVDLLPWLSLWRTAAIAAAVLLGMCACSLREHQKDPQVVACGTVPLDFDLVARTADCAMELGGAGIDEIDEDEDVDSEGTGIDGDARATSSWRAGRAKPSAFSPREEVTTIQVE